MGLGLVGGATLTRGCQKARLDPLIHVLPAYPTLNHVPRAAGRLYYAEPCKMPRAAGRPRARDDPRRRDCDGAIVSDEADMPTLRVPGCAALDAAAAFERYNAWHIDGSRYGMESGPSIVPSRQKMTFVGFHLTPAN
jgi:hypothetical protein